MIDKVSLRLQLLSCIGGIGVVPSAFQGLSWLAPLILYYLVGARERLKEHRKRKKVAATVLGAGLVEC